MDCPNPYRTGSTKPPDSGNLLLWKTPEKARRLSPIPVLSSSASFLRLLLQDGTVDLELASSVVALDPGLAYGTLQLANRQLSDESERLWQLPGAVVTTGREALQDLLERTPRVEFCGDNTRAAGLKKLIANSVARACVAQLLARELGSCDARKCYLCGLLLDLPALTRITQPEHLSFSADLLSSMCHSLPAVIVRAALAQRAEEKQPSDPLVAIVLIAEALLRAERADGEPGLEELSNRALWQSWAAIPVLQRAALLKGCCTVLKWTLANFYRLNPWEFVACLEQRKPFEGYGTHPDLDRGELVC